MSSVWYATREAVKDALDTAETARNNGQVDRAIDSASRSVEGLLHRRFRPQLATRSFDWPDRRRPRSWRLWLDGDEVIEVDTLTAGGVVIPTGDFLLEPANSGPPFSAIEIDLSTSSAFQAGDTHQRAITVQGLFGYRNDETQVGELTGDLADSATATASVGWTDPKVGVGDVLRIDDERMIVVGRTMVDSAQDLGGDLTAAASDVTVAVADGSAFTAEQVILVDAERMLVVDVAGNNLVVKRAWDGSVLATHSTGANVFGLTGVQLDRGRLGTTRAAHTTGAAIWRHEVPGLVRELCVAEALNTIQQEQSGYARTFGSGENVRLVGGRGLADIRAEAKARYGRKSRLGVI